MSLNFHSVFSNLLDDFISYKRGLGYSYKSEVQILRKFDAFCMELNIEVPILTKDIVDAWCQKKPYESHRSNFQQRVTCIRQFAIYLTESGHEAYIPVNLNYIRQRKSKYSAYIFTHEEMNKIFEESDRIYPNRQSTMHLVMPVLIRLLYCTGMRVMEALNLKLTDLDLSLGVLTIRNAKFNKDRLIPVSNSMLDVLKQYCEVMHPYYQPEDYLFIGVTRLPYSHQSIYYRFREILVQAGIPHAGRGHGPRIHDIRHTFCCHTLERAVTHKSDLTNLLPVLSAYLGHESVRGTSLYLKMTAEIYPDVIEAVTKICSYVIPEVTL